MLSGTITDKSGRLMSGQTIDAFYTSIEHARPLAVGLNCGGGAPQLRPYIEDLAGQAGEYILCYPNAGLPNAFGGYDEQPADVAAPPRTTSARLRRRCRVCPRDVGRKRARGPCAWPGWTP